MIQPEFQYKNITTQDTFILETSACLLHAVSINKPVANSVVGLYDNALGTTANPVAVITSPASPDELFTLFYDVRLANGLTVITSVANPNITVAYQQ